MVLPILEGGVRLVHPRQTKRASVPSSPYPVVLAPLVLFHVALGLDQGLIRDDDSIAMPDADSAVPQSPVSGNVPSARGLPWWAPGPAALPVSEGCSVGSRSCPLVLYFPWPAQRPTRLAPYRPYYCAYGRSTFLRPL